MRNALLTLLILSASLPTLAQPPGAVDTLIEKARGDSKIPGVSVAVVREGKTIVLRGYGLANAETGTLATEKTAFQLASVTKQFTAAAVLLLVEEGKVTLDTPFVTYLTSLPEAWRRAWKDVTVRQLLNHTSGIASYTDLPGFEKTTRTDYKPQELLGLVADMPLKWKPGAQWAYNNTGYFLLGLVIEKVAGKSYNDFLTERIFKPLGMNETRVNDLRDVIPNRATGYSRGPKGLQNGEYTSPTQPFSAGALISTVTDMAKWTAAIDAGKVLKPASWSAAWIPTKLADGTTKDYGFGWSLGKLNGHPVIEHGGGIPGFSTFVLRLPADHLSVVVLTNQEAGDAGQLAHRLAALYVPGIQVPPAKAISDPDPALTKRLRIILTGMTKGEATESEFVPEFWKFLYPDRLKEGATSLASLGELRALVLLSRDPKPELTRLEYRAVFAKGTMKVGFVLNKEGKIGGIGLRPE